MMIFFIRLYQRLFRPLIDSFCLSVFGFVSSCPQTPSCSEYTILQIKTHGTIGGLKRGLWRVWHCR